MIVGFQSLWTLGLVIGCQILTSSAIDSVPILLWDHHSKGSSFEPYDPFHTTSQDEFKETLKKKLKNSWPPVVVFIKESFCTEDFTQNKNSIELKNASIVFLSAVKSPVPFLKNLFSYEQIEKTQLESIGDNKLAIVNVKTVEDALKTYKAVRESSPNLVAILTGNSCSFNSERVRRARRAEVDASNEVKINETSLFFNGSDGEVLLYSSQFPFIKTTINGSYEQLASLSNASVAKRINNTLILSLTFSSPSDVKIKTKFNFTKSFGYYTLTNLTFTDTNHTNEIPLTTRTKLYVQRNFSYFCEEDLLFKWSMKNQKGDIIDSVTFKFTDIQLQFDAKGAFGESLNCIGFTTIPIWTGIFVTFILALILIWGLTMIVDIRTMDRFDDPKGKTITISAQE